MNLPLHTKIQKHKEKIKINRANAGLWFERFFYAYQDDWKELDKKGENSQFIQWLNNIKNYNVNQDVLDEYVKRQYQMTDALKGKNAIFKTTWHFVTGMGNPHPVENGFTWHHTLGVPYIPGSAVKGLVRTWVELWMTFHDEKAKQETLMQWFGSDHKKAELRVQEAQTGGIIFFDAIPITKPELTIDIMTPHMGKWYEAGGEISDINERPEAVPADWHDPRPIQYLAVKKASFLFCIVPRNKEVADDLQTIMQALEDALVWLGAGAKTAVGYGQMKKDKTACKEQEQKLQQERAETQKKTEFEKKIRGLSPIAREFAKQCEQENWDDKDKFWNIEVINGWLDKVEQKREDYIINELCKLMKKHFPGIMDNPDKTKGKKEKHKYKENQRNIAKRLITLQKTRIDATSQNSPKRP